MAAPTFIVEYVDGNAEEVKLLPRAQIAYEKEQKKSLRSDFDSLTDLYRLAWYACGKPDDKMENWIENVESVEPVEDEDSDPTSPEPSSD